MSDECMKCGAKVPSDVSVCERCDAMPAPRPIATAPKISEGPRLLLFYFGAWRIGFWDDVVVDHGYTQWSDDSEEYFFLLPGPTHWLPLPPNP